MIAIPSLVAHNYLSEKAQVIVTDLERESMRVLRGVFVVTEAPATVELRSIAEE